MKHLEKRERIVLIAITIVILTVTYFELYYIPLVKKTRELHSSINQYTNILQQKRVLGEDKNQDHITLANIEKEYIKLYKQLPNHEENDQIVYDIKKFCEQAQIEFEMIEFSEPSLYPYKDKQSAYEIFITPVFITIIGDYNGVAYFVRCIEESERIASVVGVNLSDIRDNTEKFLVKVNVEYYFVKELDGNRVDEDS